jgi:tRNA U54 and U55 pseudouridine synthase Pus10
VALVWTQSPACTECTGRCSLQTVHERRNSEGGWMLHQQMDMIGLSIQSK